MRLLCWLLRLLPMWDYICPRCRRNVKPNSHKCVHCGEQYGNPLRVPPKCLKDKKALEDYVHKHIFPRISARQRNYLAQYFTVLFSDGFESGDFSAWTGTEAGGGGTISVVTDQKHHGSYSAYSNAPASGWANVYKTLGTAQPECYIRWYIMFNTLPPSSGLQAPILRASATGTEMVRFFIKNYLGQLQLYGQFFPWVTYATYNYAFQTGVWYCLEYGYKKGSGTDGFHKVWLNGQLVINLENRDHTGIGDASTYKIGNCYSVSGYTSQLWIDCAVIADTYIGQEPSGQTYEISVGAVTQSLSVPAAQTTYGISKDASVTSDGLHAAESTFNVLHDAISKALADLELQRILEISKDAVAIPISTPLIESIFNVSLDATVKLFTEVDIAKEGEVKVTRVFLVLGDLAIQLTGG